MKQGKKYPFKNIEVHKWQGTVPPVSLVRTVLKSLVTYPYFVRLNGFPLGTDRAEHLSGLILALEKYIGPVSSKPISYTNVSINQRQAVRERSVTAYSRTAEALAPHTDSTYLANPHDVVAFQCEIADMEGGETAMVAVDDILAHLSEKTLSLLCECQFDFGRGTHSILHTLADTGIPDIRYYRAQLDHTAMRNQVKFAPSVQGALSELDDSLQKNSRRFYFKLSTGEAVIMNNKRVLHARDQFREDSARKFYRIRRHMDLASFQPTPSFIVFLKNIFGARKTKERKTPQALHHDEHPKNARAKASVRAGDFETARRLYEAVLLENPTDYSALKALAAISYKQSDFENAESYRKKFCTIHPFAIVSDNEKRPIVLKARGLRGIKYTYKQMASGYKRTLQRGHFSLKNFVPNDLCSLQSLNVYDETVPILEPAPPNIRLLINSISCGDRMKPSLMALNDFLKDNAHLRVINNPLEVLKTTRANNYKRLNGLAGLEFPRTEAIDHDGTEDSRQNMHALIKAGFEFPLMVRPRFTHTGSGLRLVANFQELDTYFAENSEETCFYIIQWKNLKNEQGLYNKIRVFCIDGTYYPIAHLMHNDWNVHSGDRYSVMDKSAELQELEQRYLRDMDGFLGETAMSCLQAIRDVIKLDFFGIDFTLKEDGTLYVFECNAAMRHNYDHAGMFPYTRRTLDAASNAFAEMVQKRL